MFVLIPFSLLIAAIVMAAIRTTVRGQLPACATCTSERRRFVAAVVARIVLLLFTVAALVMSFSGDAFRTRGVLSRDTLWVELKGVDRRFAGQVDRALRAPTFPVR